MSFERLLRVITKPMKPLVILFLWLGWLTAATASATTPMVTPMPDGQVAADSAALFLEDTSGSLDFETIKTPTWQAKFQHAADQTHFNRGITNAVYWVKLVIAPVDTRSFAGRHSHLGGLVIEVPYAPLDEVQFYQDDIEGHTIHFEAGDTKLFASRPIKHSTPVFPIKRMENQPSTIYLRVTSSGTLRIPLVVWEEKTFFDHSKTQLLIFGLYFGIMLLMILYNLLFFIWLKDISFFHYILYISALSVFQAAYFGMGFQYIWSPFPWFNQYAIVLMIFVVGLFSAAFAREVLNLKKTMPEIDRYAKAVLVFFLVAAPACFVLPYSVMLLVGTLSTILQSIALIVISSINAIKGHRSSKMFLIAWMALLAGAVVLGGVTLGIIPANGLTSHAMLIGSTLEMILLAIMLADRVRIMEMEKTRTEKKAKVALQAVNRALLDSNRVKDEFLATISHEMRTPMNGVINCLIQASGEQNDKLRDDFIDNAEDAAKHLMNLIESVLSYTELQSHEFKINRENFSLQRMLEPISDTYDRMAKQKGIRFFIKVNPDVPNSLWGDRRRLQQILVNLVDNAVKFTSQGAATLKVSVDSIDTEHKRVQLAFSVTDTGIGIPPGMESVVFDRFKQFSGNHNRRHGGLGIGLAVCKQIAALMGADLRYRSTVGEGTEFIMAINLEYANSPAKHMADTIDIHAVTEGRCALIVEDNPVNQLVLKAALNKLGLATVCANNGEEGIRAVENNDLDVILMDCQMPVMDGFEATRHIRALSSDKSNVPIIAITANAMSRDKDLCLESGMNDYMSKPVNVKLLEDILMRWLPHPTAEPLSPAQSRAQTG